MIASPGQTNRLGQGSEVFSRQPPGELIDVGGFRLHLRCMGEGRPTVIVETSLGGHMDGWTRVQAVAARQSRVCLYDRAGSGWSDVDRHVPTLERMVRNLRVVLSNAGIEGPYILAGLGEGGLLLRRFAASHPDEVFALLLIDSLHENQIRRTPKAMMEGPMSDVAPTRFCRVEAPMSAVRASGLVNAYLPIGSPENLRPMQPEAIQKTRYCAAVRAEAPVFRAAANQSEPPSPLGDLPLIVLTAGRGMNLDPLASDTGLRADALSEWDTLWLKLQAELANLSTNSVHRIVEDAGHFVQLDRPDAVIDAIQELLSMARCCRIYE
jgi:pimeloyl-ACP methyl ester carboxylesterase